MGKYDNVTEFEKDLDFNGREKWAVLISIANELAEANRLKRLELLRLKLPYNEDEIPNWAKDLEDQA